MPDKKFPSKANIVITKTRRTKKPEEEKKSSLTIKRPTIKQRLRKADTRRRRPSGKVRFYDLGQTAAGVTNPFTFLGVPYVNYGSGTQYGYWVFVENIPLAQMNVMNNAIIANNVNQFQTLYKEIKKSVGQGYGIQIEGTDSNADPFFYDSRLSYPNWTEEGLTLTTAQLNGTELRFKDLSTSNEFADQKYGMLFTAFDVKDTVGYKITASYDYNAAVVPYEFENGDIVFFFPKIVNRGGISSSSGTFPVDFRVHYQDLIYCVRPRVFSQPNARFTAYAGEFGHLPAYFTEVHNRILALDPNRTFTLTAYGNGNVPTLADGGTFPSATPNFIPNSAWFEGAYGGGAIAGLILAVIKKGSSFYYVWSRQEI